MHQLRIVYETSDELVVYKPRGMACEKRVETAGDSLLSILTGALNQQVFLPHRLDAITCGLVLAARSKEAVAFHNRQIANHHWQKYYLARVRWEKGLSADRFIGRHKAFLKRKGTRAMVVTSGGAPSFLEILAIDDINGVPDERHVLIRLLTGRYHQIRVMFQSMGIPLTGDPLYSSRQESTERFYLEHAAMGFVQKGTGQWQRVITPSNELAETLSGTLYHRLQEESLRQPAPGGC